MFIADIAKGKSGWIVLKKSKPVLFWVGVRVSRGTAFQDRLTEGTSLLRQPSQLPCVGFPFLPLSASSFPADFFNTIGGFLPVRISEREAKKRTKLHWQRLAAFRPHLSD